MTFSQMLLEKEIAEETFNPYTKTKTFTEWQTPVALYTYLDSIYGFQVDAAANESNHLSPFWYGPGSSYNTDALDVPKWFSPAWCNPPYGKGIEKWLEEFHAQQLSGGTVVALVPARTGTRWWQKGIVPYADIIFLSGRVRFVDPSGPEKNSPDHESALCIYGPLTGGTAKWWDWRKDVVGYTG